MIGFDDIKRMKRERGPRYLVVGTVRAGEFVAWYADSSQAAEKIEAQMEADGLRQVQVMLPSELVDTEESLRKYGRALSEARAAEREALATARAAAIRASEAGLSEAGTARALGVDRMAVRGWLGKR